MKFKIVNRKKFIKLPIVILGLLFILMCIFTTKTSSNTQVSYKTIYISKGETHENHICRKQI